MATGDLRVKTYGGTMLAQAQKNFKRVSVTIKEKSGQMGFLTRSEINGLIREAYRLAGELWHTEMRPKHFMQSAYAEYGYAARKRGYNKRKGHSIPLVLTGYSRDNSATCRIVATVNGVRVIMPLVRVLNFKPPHSSINMRDEFTRLSNRDKVALARIMREYLQFEFKRRNTKAKIRIIL